MKEQAKPHIVELNAAEFQEARRRVPDSLVQELGGLAKDVVIYGAHVEVDESGNEVVSFVNLTKGDVGTQLKAEVNGEENANYSLALGALQEKREKQATELLEVTAEETGNAVEVAGGNNEKYLEDQKQLASSLRYIADVQVRQEDAPQAKKSLDEELANEALSIVTSEDLVSDELKVVALAAYLGAVEGPHDRGEMATVLERMLAEQGVEDSEIDAISTRVRADNAWLNDYGQRERQERKDQAVGDYSSYMQEFRDTPASEKSRRLSMLVMSTYSASISSLDAYNNLLYPDIRTEIETAFAELADTNTDS